MGREKKGRSNGEIEEREGEGWREKRGRSKGRERREVGRRGEREER